MAYVTDIFTITSGTWTTFSGVDPDELVIWHDAENAFDTTPGTSTHSWNTFTHNNRIRNNTYFLTALPSGVLAGSISQDIIGVEIGVSGTLEYENKSKLYVFPQTYDDELQFVWDRNFLVPLSTSTSTAWVDVSSVGFTYKRLLKTKFNFFVINNNDSVASESISKIDINQIYIKIKHWKNPSTVSKKVEGTIYLNTYIRNKLNNTRSRKVISNITFTSTATPYGDDWYGYKQDSFHDGDIDPVWIREDYTTSGVTGSGVELDGCYRLYTPTVVRQYMPHKDNFDIQLKFIGTDKKITNGLYYFGYQIDDDNYIYVGFNNSKIYSKYKYKIGITAGVGGSIRSWWEQPPYFARIKKENNKVTVYHSTTEGVWQESHSNKNITTVSGVSGYIYFSAFHDADEGDYYVDVDYVKGLNRPEHVPERYNKKVISGLFINTTSSGGI